MGGTIVLDETVTKTASAGSADGIGGHAFLEVAFVPTLNGKCPVRDVLDRLGDAWSVLVVLHLRAAPCRFNALKRRIDGISQRMLTVTLRHLERDGLVSRQVFPTNPPQVEYALTEMGHSLAVPIDALTRWAADHHRSIDAARSAHDGARSRHMVG